MKAGPSAEAGVRHVRAAILPLGVVSLLVGCHGQGRVEVAALNFRAIDPPAPRVAKLKVDSCTWWLDDEGRICIAMDRKQPVLLGAAGEFVFQLSMVLDKPPRGRARNYLVSKRELQGIARFGPAAARYVSLSGIVALYREPGERLRGSFRLQVARQSSQMLGGWGRPRRHLMMGTFVAVPDDGRGRQIAAETEALSREREPRAELAPTTAPASRPFIAR